MKYEHEKKRTNCEYSILDLNISSVTVNLMDQIENVREN